MNYQKYYYKLIIAYDGTDYFGLQEIKNLKTIQAELNEVLTKLLNCRLTTKVFSRTDTGVHAFEQVLKLTTEKEFFEEMRLEFNRICSPIKILAFNKVEFSFNPNLTKALKEYRYYFTNEKINPNYRFISNISNVLNLDLIDKNLDIFIGEKNYINFCSKGSNVKSTVRVIYSLKIKKVDFEQIAKNNPLFKMTSYPKECFEITIIGEGFLKQMVRHIVSSIWCIGTAKLNREDVVELFGGNCHPKKLWKVAPASGLFLVGLINNEKNIK